MIKQFFTSLIYIIACSYPIQPHIYIADISHLLVNPVTFNMTTQ